MAQISKESILRCNVNEEY